MSNFYISILKNKKILFLGLFVFVMAGIFVPTIILADTRRAINLILPIRTYVPPAPMDGLPDLILPYQFTINGSGFLLDDKVWYLFRKTDCAYLFCDTANNWTAWLAAGDAPGSTKTFLSSSQILVTIPINVKYAKFGLLSQQGQMRVIINQNEDGAPGWIINYFVSAGIAELRVDNSFSAIYDKISDGIEEMTDFFSDLSDALSLSWTDFWVLLIVEITNFFSELSYIVARASSEIFLYILAALIEDPNDNWSITKGIGISASFLVAWNVIKGYANMLIVLSLIAVSTMLILQIKQWADKAKTLLPQIIITALLVNFSVVLVGLPIDATNIVIRSFTVGAEAEVGLVRRVNQSWNSIARPLRFPVDVGGAIKYFAVNVAFNFMYALISISFLWFALMVIQRYFILAALFILSPLAFVFRAVPYEKAHAQWTKWLETFLKNCFILIPAVFFLKLSVSILEAIPPSGWTTGDGPQDLLKVALNFSIVIGFMLLGLKMAAKNSGPIVNAIMGAVAAIGAMLITGGASLGMSAAGKVGGGAH